MEYKELGIGNKINMLRVKDAEGNRTQSKQYISQMLDLDAVHKIAKIAMPIENKVIVPLEIGDIYRIIIYTSNGLFQCMCKIMKRYKEEGLYVLDVSLMGKLEKFQRRQYFRLLCDITLVHRLETDEEVTLKKLIEEDDFENDRMKRLCIEEYNNLKFEWMDGEVVDLSGGGIRFKCSMEYQPESIVVVKMPVIYDDTGSLVPVRTRIIRSSRDFGGSYTQYDVRGEFVGLNSKTREKLVRYIFDEQRRRMKR